MRVAIPTWQGGVSPVLDVARNLVLVDIEAGAEHGRREVALNEASVSARAARLASLAPDVLICGAVSRPLEQALLSSGIRVVAQVCGAADEVLAAYLAGRLSDAVFRMPGCGRLPLARDPKARRDRAGGQDQRMQA